MKDRPDPNAASRFPASRRRLYDQAFRLAGLGAWECELATERLTWTEGVYELFGLSTDASLRRASILGLYTDQSRHEMESMRAEAIRNGRGFELDAEIRVRRGESRWMRLSADVACEDGRPVRIFGAKQDITAEREILSRLRRMAERDSLTGLANRAVFETRYRHVVDGLNAPAAVSGIVLVDVDGLKQINDSRGHLAGDACLREVATRLRRAFRGARLIARIGGDEFAVLLQGPLGPARIERLLQDTSAVLCRPFGWNGVALELGASIGARILGWPPHLITSDLFAEADSALYAAKAAGRNSVSIFGENRPEVPAITSGRIPASAAGTAAPGWRPTRAGRRKSPAS